MVNGSVIMCLCVMYLLMWCVKVLVLCGCLVMLLELFIIKFCFMKVFRLVLFMLNDMMFVLLCWIMLMVVLMGLMFSFFFSVLSDCLLYLGLVEISICVVGLLCCCMVFFMLVVMCVCVVGFFRCLSSVLLLLLCV